MKIELLATQVYVPIIAEYESVQAAKRKGKDMVDRNIAYPLAIVKDGEVSEVRLGPDYRWHAPDNSELAEVQPYLDQVYGRSGE